VEGNAQIVFRRGLWDRPNLVPDGLEEYLLGELEQDIYGALPHVTR
jgi:hypothetical protein